MICAWLRAVVLSAAFAASLTPVRCLAQYGYVYAIKGLSPELLSLFQQKSMPKNSRILLRIFKEDSELELWKQDTSGHYQILKTYPICRWSGALGPKLHEGDGQAPGVDNHNALQIRQSTQYIVIRLRHRNIQEFAILHRGRPAIACW